MQTRRWVAAAATAGLVVGLAVAGSASASADILMGNVVDEFSTDYGSGYPLDNCTWETFGDGPLGNAVTYTAPSSGNVTFALTAQSWDNGSVVAVFDTSYAQANCITSTLALAPSLPSVTLPVTAGHDYVVLVWGCSGSCAAATDNYGTYTLEATGLATGGSPMDLTPWLKAYARGGQDVTCEDGWSPSWAQWPNDGQGGWVCEKSERAYLS
ncbi:MAG: hypothetical protein GC156_03875 [Actinomycetales bacterium]|nr:hypothetical protein [Actinomycetales bacterium]